MDKYEYRIKAEQIEKLYRKKDYETAKKIADTIDWRRVRNISMLFMISDIYEKNENYEESKEILHLAYERSPLGRMIVYKLVEICIRLNEYEEAIEFYREYIQLAPHDPGKYLLKYKIHKGMNAPPKELIPILEQFKEKEYHEEWAYELASLYHQDGMGTKCVEECDELILWFDKGKYVEKAMELKMLYQPLSPVQQEKYDHRNDVIEEVENVEKVEELEPAQEEKNSPEEVFDPKTEIKMDVSDDHNSEEDTIDIDIKDKEDVKDIEDIEDNKTKGKFPFSRFFLNKKILSTEVHGETLQEDEVVHVGSPSVDKFSTINLQAELAKSMEKILSSANDQKEEKSEKERDEAREKPFEKILSEGDDGQITLNIPEEIEIDKQITGQMHIEEILAELEKLKETKEVKAVYATGDIMDILSDVVPKIEDAEESLKASDKVHQTEKSVEEIEDLVMDEEVVEESEEPVMDEEVAEESQEPVTNEEAIQEVAATTDKKKSISEFEDMEKKITAAIERLELHPTEAKAQDTEPDSQENNFIEDKMFEEFKYSPFTMNQLNNVVHRLEKADSIADKGEIKNIIVTGDPGTGKTTLAIGILKLIQKKSYQKLGKVAKIQGEALNKKEISKVIEKLSGGALIIEEAGKLSEKTINDLDILMTSDGNQIAIVLEDEKKALEQLLSKYECFASKFASKINLPGYSNEELVNFGRQYANKKGYEVDEMGVLALYTRIDQIQDDNRAIKLDEIQEILDEAIEYSKKKKISKLINKILGKRYSETDLILLHEQDFQV